MSQPFIYVFALIVGGLILVWGIRTVIDLKDTADIVDLGKFKNDFEADAKSRYNLGTGSMKKHSVRLGGDVKYVCFTDPGTEINCKLKFNGDISDCSLDDLDDEVFELRLEADDDNNMWFLPLTAAKFNSFKINHIQPKEIDGKIANPLCYANGEKIVMTTKSTFVELS